MSILYTFLMIWVALLILAGIAYFLLKVLSESASSFKVKRSLWLSQMLNKLKESDLVKKWNALSVGQKIAVIVIILIPMAGMSYYLTNPKKRQHYGT